MNRAAGYKVHKDEIEFMANSIIEEYGERYFKFGEVHKIMRCGVNTVAHILQEAGVTIKSVGPKKMVSAYDIAYAMYYGRVAPIDNTSRTGRTYG